MTSTQASQRTYHILSTLETLIIPVEWATQAGYHRVVVMETLCVFPVLRYVNVFVNMHFSCTRVLYHKRGRACGAVWACPCGRVNTNAWVFLHVCPRGCGNAHVGVGVCTRVLLCVCVCVSALIVDPSVRSAADHGRVPGNGSGRVAVWKHRGHSGILLGGEPHPACLWPTLSHGRYVPANCLPLAFVCVCVCVCV